MSEESIPFIHVPSRTTVRAPASMSHELCSPLYGPDVLLVVSSITGAAGNTCRVRKRRASIKVLQWTTRSTVRAAMATLTTVVDRPRRRPAGHAKMGLVVSYQESCKRKLELELIQSQMAQKPMLRGEVGARGLRVQSVSREEVWASAGVQGAWVSDIGCG